MRTLDLFPRDDPIEVLCIGAHSDDIEIGCSATVLEWLDRWRDCKVTWVVLSAADARADEATRSYEGLMRTAKAGQIILGPFRDSYFPAEFAELKDFFENVRAKTNPDVIFTHRLEDRHQDHRLVSELTWQTWRNNLILEYEIPKFEGDLGLPNLYVPLTKSSADRKVAHLMGIFASQRSRSWFNPETFTALMSLRGLECRADSGYAEAFTARKIVT